MNLKSVLQLACISSVLFFTRAGAESLLTDAQTTTAPVAQDLLKNPYGVEAIWQQGDLVAKATLAILVLMSLGSWYVGILKWFEQARVLRNAKEVSSRFWQAASIQEAMQALHPDSAFRYLAEIGHQAQRQPNQGLQRGIAPQIWIELALQKAIDDIGNRLQGGLGFLASVASTAPFVGLFGTVWGVYHALTAIGIAGQASIGKVAGPVGEALIMTAIGLAVAVPAVLGYNWLVRRNKIALGEVRSFNAQLYQLLLATSTDK